MSDYSAYEEIHEFLAHLCDCETCLAKREVDFLQQCHIAFPDALSFGSHELVTIVLRLLDQGRVEWKTRGLTVQITDTGRQSLA